MLVSAATLPFDFRIAQKQVLISPGLSRLMTVVNGLFPGPLIRVPYGSHIQVDVLNDLPDNATTIHWHGIHQRGTPYYDGVATQSQCPLQSRKSMSYSFTASPSGTAFWHAHFHSENVDGLYGPLIVDDTNGSFPFSFDDEKVILLTDSYDNSSWALERYLSTPPSLDNPQPHVDPTPSYGLLCIYDESVFPAVPSCSSSSTGQGFNLDFHPGKTYRLRLIGASELAPFVFSIDEHELQIVATDYFAVNSSTWVTSIPITTGQRYDVLVRARENIAPGTAFWVRATLQSQCWPYRGALDNDVRGTVTYGALAAPPTSKSWNATNPTCGGVDYSILKPAVPAPPLPDPNPVLTLFLNYTFPVLTNDIVHTLVNGKAYHVADDAYPTLFHVNEDPTWQPQTPGEERNLMVIPDFAQGKEVRLLMRSSGFPGTHPFHSHGRGLKILAFGSGNFTQDDLAKVNAVDVQNVITRDTVIVPSLGWVMTQFTADNPGVWPIHCHVGWHLQNGMLGQIVELPKAIASDIHIPQQLKDMCTK